ncbi:MAG: sulfatase-like hydrolase/transferase [Planctomycetota bacterium]|nr:sulfatase-like hydrolase/transferase [Planctomycetota bacterium]
MQRCEKRQIAITDLEGHGSCRVEISKNVAPARVLTLPQLWLMLLLAGVCVLLFSPNLPAAERPNIILVMADDQGWGDVGYNGHEILRTPHLDAMAAAGLRFERFYAAAPVCSPTRGSCLTGRHPFRYGVLFANVGHMLPREITLAELLKDAGYATGHFGKWHLGTLTKAEKDSNRGGPGGATHFSPPWRNGFEECFSTEAKTPTWDPLLRPKSAKGGTWWDPVGSLGDANPYGTAYWSQAGEKVVENLRGDDSRAIMDRAIPFVRRSVDRGKPFFAVIWFHAPHLPVVSGKKYTKPYAAHSKHHQHYWGCITALDEQVGRLRGELRKLNVADNTMLWYCADNGPEGNARTPGSAGQLRGRKRSLHEGGVRVPGILEWPARVKGGQTTDLPAVTSDYLPTILEAVELRMPDNRPLDGVSLIPLIDGRMKQRPRPIGFQSGGQVSWIDNQYKLIRIRAAKRRRGENNESDEPDGFMLFDLDADLSEQNDVAADHPEIVKLMSAQLKSWQQSCAASRAGADFVKDSRPD